MTNGKNSDRVYESWESAFVPWTAIPRGSKERNMTNATTVFEFKRRLLNVLRELDSIESDMNGLSARLADDIDPICHGLIRADVHLTGAFNDLVKLQKRYEKEEAK